MSEIPESILKTAEAIFAAMESVSEIARDTVCGRNDTKMIARALMAEREACAEIAWDRATHIRDMFDGVDDDEEAAYISGELDEAYRIAAAIRNR